MTSVVYVILLVGAVLLTTALLQYRLSVAKIDRQYLLTFAGAYLFSITLVHLIPELFHDNDAPYTIGIFLLGGFFLQVLMDHFSRGIEHGHVHNKREGLNAYAVLAILMVHSFMEGTLVSDSFAAHAHSTSIVSGIIIHKIPATIALYLIVKEFAPSKVWLLMTLFAFASPLGLFVGEIFSQKQVFSPESMLAYFALVCGGLLHLSTTLFYESNKGHELNRKKLLISASAALLAVLSLQF